MIQEAKESFASPDYSFYGKSHIVKLLYHLINLQIECLILQYIIQENICDMAFLRETGLCTQRAFQDFLPQYLPLVVSH